MLNETKVQELDQDSSKTKDEKRFEVIRWNSVFNWSWSFSEPICAICRNQLMDPCIKCEAEQEHNTQDCSVIWGECNHVFHLHCIYKFVKNRPICPMDNEEWIPQPKYSNI
eukprot:NODE_11466_length_451_cov_12.335366_g10811_i0.p1 GENE.NODE_11466_length_451_cov_12.335366_g10811_i0~~NODE_11466_length_451_cov_12.335366_g10811_i0.p1  ORF type:complete len:121 (+),score=24.91 NODE_11466_length_451_cov_12.335366_g10811_i0:32-364(+)